MTTETTQPTENAKASDQPVVPARHRVVDFLSLEGRFLVVVSGEGSSPGELMDDASECHQELTMRLWQDCEIDDKEWIIDELRDPNNWKFDESDRPYWWQIDIGEITQLHVICVTPA